ncbi:virulence factor Mce family protein [Bordetella ansorpii]|uniref:Virulence factor Mce family protein n=1 Tax=Bordetella ansorpii TaxID=288768 RepID=A0A157S9P7_9BORD|nr:MlaD family protein [Bordetella ansorpii]SAI67160.1 virulence factor Mce family protein [Bordetella ansorpii]
MENRSHALLAGLFTLVLLAAAALVAVWLSRDRSQQAIYEIISSTAVTGLTAQSSVRYQGVPVGKVQALALNTERPGQVRIRIGVAPNTPITESTWAELGVQGITGGANVELRDDGAQPRLLATSADHPAAIPLRPGFFDRVQQRGTAVLENVDRATQQLSQLLSQQNVQAMTAMLQNAADMSSQFKQASQDLGPLVRRLDSVADEMRGAAEQAKGLMFDARQALARLDGPNGPMAAATQSMQQITWAAARLDNDTLPALSRMANGVSGAARTAQSALRRVGDTPQSFLFGPPPVQAGPGEPGFAGFGQGPQ